MINTTQFDYNSIPVGYYDEVFHRQSGIQSKWHHIKFREVAKKLPMNGQHCDIGCAAGTFIGNFTNENLSSVGIDISELQIEYAISKYKSNKNNFLLTTPNFSNLPTDYYDYVTSIELIEHLNYDDINKILINIHKILKPGGRLILTTPNYKSLYPLIEFFVNKLGRVSYEEQHISKFTLQKLINIIPNNYKLIQCETRVGFAPFLAGFNWLMPDYVNKFENYLFNKINYGHILFLELEKI